MNWNDVLLSKSIKATCCSLLVVTIASAAPPARPVRSAPEQKDSTEKSKPSGPAKYDLPEHNVRFQTPGDWLSAGSVSGTCKGAYVTLANLPFRDKPAKSKTKAKGDGDPKAPPSPANSEFASLFTFVVDPADVDVSSLDAAVTTMQAQIKKTYADATFDAARDVKLAGEPAKQFIASFTMPHPIGGQALPRKQSIVMTRHAGKVYRLAVEASVPNFDADKGALERVKTTVTWLDEAGRKGPAGMGGTAFRNAEHGLQLQQPAGWDAGESSIPGSIATFIPPGDPNGFVELFWRDPQGKDVDAILTSLQGEVRDHDANAKFDPIQDAKLGGEPARMFTYHVKLGDTEKSCQMLASLHAGKAYVIMYGAPPAEYEKNVGAVKRLVDSFRWTTQGSDKTPATRPAAH